MARFRSDPAMVWWLIQRRKRQQETAEPVENPELLTNPGGPFVDTTGWTAGFEDFAAASGGGTVTVISGDLWVDNAGTSGDNTVAVTEIPNTENGATYNVSYTRSSVGGQGAVNGQGVVYDANPLETTANQIGGSTATNIAPGGSETFTFTGTGGSVWFRLGHNGTGNTVSSAWSVASIKKAT